MTGLGAALDACGSASAWRQALEVLRAARRRQKWWGKGWAMVKNGWKMMDKLDQLSEFGGRMVD